MKVVKDIQPPSGLTRLLFRLPILAYQLGLGSLFGRRLVLLNHIGRVSGKSRQAILEVAQYDAAHDAYVVASGWGPGAAWYRNVLKKPDVDIQIGKQTLAVTAVPLSKDAGAEIFARYAGRHRRLAKYMLRRFLGMSVDGSDADFRAVGRRLPFVRFIPR